MLVPIGNCPNDSVLSIFREVGRLIDKLGMFTLLYVSSLAFAMIGIIS